MQCARKAEILKKRRKSITQSNEAFTINEDLIDYINNIFLFNLIF